MRLWAAPLSADFYLQPSLLFSLCRFFLVSSMDGERRKRSLTSPQGAIESACSAHHLRLESQKKEALMTEQPDKQGPRAGTTGDQQPIPQESYDRPPQKPESS